MYKTLLFVATMALLLSACGGRSQDNPAVVGEDSLLMAEEPSMAPITRDVEFMAFLHRFAEDPEYQLQHIKFPLGKLSYANIMGEDGDFYPDDFTQRYWSLDNGNYMRVTDPGWFVWKNDSMIVYDYNSSLLEDECVGEFGTEFLFEKIAGEWYVTNGDFYGSDVGIADLVAGEVAATNKKFRKEHQQPYTPYEYNGIPGDYPQASERLLTEDDLKGMSPKELRLMRNEIMARHGYTFSSKDLAQHFNAQPWYSALFRNVKASLSDIEKANIDFIKMHE